jgi:UDP-glucose 4-epimerase
MIKPGSRRSMILLGALGIILFLLIFRTVMQYHSVETLGIQGSYLNVEFKEPFNILVTGGAGFIGSHIVQYFENEPMCEKIIVLDNLHTGKESNIASFKKVKLIKESILNREVVRDAITNNQVKYIFHLAALISVAESMTKVKEYYEINVDGTRIVLEEAQKAPSVKSLVLSSSAALYGSDPTVPKRESMKTDCQSPYAQTKFDGEFLCQHYTNFNTHRKDFVAVALRYFNVFGDRQDPNSEYAAAIPKFIERACNSKAITIFGDGAQTRDFVYVKDVVWANVFVAFHAKRFDVFNVGYGQYITIGELANTVVDQCGKLTKSNIPAVKNEAPRPGDVRYSMASIDKLSAAGWRPKFNFKQSLRDTIQYFYTHQLK